MKFYKVKLEQYILLITFLDIQLKEISNKNKPYWYSFVMNDI